MQKERKGEEETRKGEEETTWAHTMCVCVCNVFFAHTHTLPGGVGGCVGNVNLGVSFLSFLMFILLRPF